MLTLFPKDMMCFGSGTTTLVEITALASKKFFNYSDALAKNVGEAVSHHLTTAQIVCRAQNIVCTEGGYWQN